MADQTETKMVKVLKSWDETKSLRRIHLKAGGLKTRHKIPGQYIIASPTGEKEGFYALANGPELPEFELLIKRSQGSADAMTSLEEGDEISIQAPAGKGFPVMEHQGHDLLLFASGSAIAPLRAVIQQIMSHRDEYGKVYLYYGHYYPSEFAYRDEFSTWQKSGINLVTVATDPSKDPDALDKDISGWDGAIGFVQNAFLDSTPSLRNPIAYVCGMKEMVQAVIEALQKKNIPPEQVFQNF